MRDELETFIDETIRRGAERGYHPTTFTKMRERWTTVGAIKRLVVNGDIQSGFRKLNELGLLDCTIEAAVLKFPSRFDKGVIEAARFRLTQAGSEI